tara:strand:- start:1147 stop:1503 length:357 start_codon:yes stop_codon:yes gene_type:complete
MLKSAFFVLMTMGCAKHPTPQEASNAGLYGFAGEHFTPTNSPCLDGIIVAIDHSCAVPMEIEDGYPYITVTCTATREGAPPWHKYNVIAITNPEMEDPAGVDVLCIDPYTRVYIQDRP